MRLSQSSQPYSPGEGETFQIKHWSNAGQAKLHTQMVGHRPVCLLRGSCSWPWLNTLADRRESISRTAESIHTHTDTKHKTNRSYCWLANKCARWYPFVHFLEWNLFSCWFISQSREEGNIPSGNGVITWGNVQTLLARGQGAGSVASVGSVQTLLYWYKRWTINAWKRV